MANSAVEESLFVLHLANLFLDLKGHLDMLNPLANFLINNFLRGDIYCRIQRSPLCFNLSNFLVKLVYLSLIIRNLLIKGLPLVEEFLLFDLKRT